MAGRGGVHKGVGKDVKAGRERCVGVAKSKKKGQIIVSLGRQAPRAVAVSVSLPSCPGSGWYDWQVPSLPCPLATLAGSSSD